MAAVRRLGLFALPNVVIGGTEQDFSQSRLRCPQPAEAFTTQWLNNGNVTIAPADLPQSTYTALDLSRAMLWLWRVRSFTVSGSLEIADEDPFNIEIEPFEVKNLKFNALSLEISNENEKVCDVGMFYGEGKSAGFDDFETGSYRLRITVADLTSIWSDYPATPTLSIGSVAQRVRITSDKTTFYIPVWAELYIRALGSEFTYTSGSTTTHLSGDDKSISWQISDALGTVGRPFRFGSNNATGTINIEATEYWPYDPGDGGGPIYDSATGEQLRSFPS